MIFKLSRLVGQVAFAATIVSSPWLLGGIPVWASFCFSVGIAIVAVCCLALSFERNAWNTVSVFIFLPVGVVLYGCLQLAPLQPEQPLERFEHAAQGAIEVPSLASQGSIRNFPISVNANLTRIALADFANAALVFCFAGILWQTVRSIVAVLLLMLTNGLAFSFYGMLQRLGGDDLIYGFVELTKGGLPFASFVNRNNAAAFLLTSISAAVALIAMNGTGHRSTHEYRDSERIQQRGVALIALLAFLVAGLVATLSRGGCLSLIVATGVLMVLLSRRAIAYGLVVITGGVSLALANSFGWLDALLARFAMIDSASLSSDGRLQHWRDMLPAIWDFGAIGAGLGTYSAVSPPYQTSDRFVWFYNADSQYVEWCTELGVPVVILLVLGVVWVFSRSLLIAKTSAADTTVRGLSVGLLFLITSQLSHAVFDFGILSPAVMLSVATLASIALSFQPLEKQSEKLHLDSSRIAWTPLPALGALAVSLLVVQVNAEPSVRQIQGFWEARSVVSGDDEDPERGDNKNTIDTAVAPTARLQVLRAQLKESLKALLGPEWSARNSVLAERLEPTGLVFLTAGNEPARTELQTLFEDPELLKRAEQLHAELLVCVREQSLNGRVWAEIACVNWLLNRDPQDTLEPAAVAHALRPADLRVALLNNILAADVAGAVAAKTGFEQTATQFSDDALIVWEVARRVYSIQESFQLVSSSSPRTLLRLLEGLKPPAQQQLAELISADLATMKPESSPEEFYLAGRAAQISGDHPEASVLLETATARRPLEHIWKLALANSLIETGDLSQARSTLESAQALAPTDVSIRNRLNDVLGMYQQK